MNQFMYESPEALSSRLRALEDLLSDEREWTEAEVAEAAEIEAALASAQQADDDAFRYGHERV